MIRFLFVIIISLPFIIYYLGVGRYVERHADRYDEWARYQIAQKVIRILRYNGGVITRVYGRENLPNSGGYIMYSNHQGKYDALGIMYGHPTPCTIMMDEKRSRLPIVDPFMDLIKGSRLKKEDMRSQVLTIRKIVEEVKAGRKYIIFPEGGYDDNQNNVKDFHPGSFKCAVRAKCPIVPVAIINSYKVFESMAPSPVRTKVIYLPPMYYKDYKDMTTEQIATIVRARIMVTIAWYTRKRQIRKLDVTLKPNVTDVDEANTYINRLKYIL
ncbi:MAG: 1-acyl-sn-glycerol-3-phosphate acyltransferase [Clostridium sp.]|nr:1-acyl-sn-glycerol-3-phosphate acyltransferase [Clostridium sp.]MCM1459418.1 1-acyl-sn-glycerol-3-phosphate acyltransferase [Bacteroides sp.]